MTRVIKTRKALLWITAAALIIALSAGAVLMLFTARTGTAENVIDFGAGIRAALVETTKDDDGEDVDNVAGKDGFTGINFGEVAPGQVLGKKPKVVRQDATADAATANDAYVAVKASVIATTPNSEGDGDTILSDDKLKSSLKDLLKQFANNEGTLDYNNTAWVLLAAKDTDTDALFTGWFFYINGGEDENKQLRVLPPLTDGKASETPYIFEKITIPTYKGADLETYAELAKAGVELTLKLEPYLVQSENNPYNELKEHSGNIEDYHTAFGAFTQKTT